MNEYISIRNQSCPNKYCRFYGKTLEGNIITHSQKARRMKCKSCSKTWVAHRDEIYYGLRSDHKKIAEAVKMLQQKISIRMIATLLKASPSTILRWKARIKKDSIIEF